MRDAAQMRHSVRQRPIPEPEAILHEPLGPASAAPTGWTPEDGEAMEHLVRCLGEAVARRTLRGRQRDSRPTS